MPIANTKYRIASQVDMLLVKLVELNVSENIMLVY